jgi:hypothetical protein
MTVWIYIDTRKEVGDTTSQSLPARKPRKPKGETIRQLVEIGLKAKGNRRIAMIRKGWSYKEDRRLSELAGKTLEQIAKAMDRTPDGIRNRSIRLGVSIKSQATTRKIMG